MMNEKKQDNLSLLKTIIYVYGNMVFEKNQLKTEKKFSLKTEIRKKIERNKAQVNEQSKELIHALLKTHKNDIYQELISLINEAAKSLEKECDFAIREVRKILMDVAIKNSKKSYFRRLIEIHRGKTILVTFTSGILFLKWLWLISITAPVSSIEGLHQRLKVFEKNNAYIKDSNTHVTKGAAFKFIYDWTGKPTDKEFEALNELVELSDSVAGELLGHNFMCKISPYSYNKYTIISVVNEYVIKNKDLSSSSRDVINNALEEKFKC